MSYRNRNRRRYMLAHALTNAVSTTVEQEREQARERLTANALAAALANPASRDYVKPDWLRAEDEAGAGEWDSDDAILDRVMEDIARTTGGRS